MTSSAQARVIRHLETHGGYVHVEVERTPTRRKTYTRVGFSIAPRTAPRVRYATVAAMIASGRLIRGTYGWTLAK